MKNKGFTIIEIMVVTALVALLFSSLLGVLINSQTYWDKGLNKVTEQEEARQVMDMLVKDLRESNTYWGINISSSEIVFYNPDYDSTGNMTGTHWIGYKIDPTNSTRLLRKVDGDAGYSTIASHIKSISFAGSTDGCQTFNNNTVPSSCPRVRITIVTRKDNNFTLSSDVVLRNQCIDSAGIPPGPGDF